jgi:hypothetical protein
MDAADGRANARAKIAEAMADRGWNVSDLARAANIDVGTAGDLMNAIRWPQRATQNKIELALGWSPGSIGSYQRGEEPPPSSETVGTRTQDDGVLLSMPPEALEGLSPADREEVITAAKLSALQTARAIRRRLDDEAHER